MSTDDDWVGTPPEGRYTRDRAKPDFWLKQRPLVVTAGSLAMIVLIVVVIVLAA